MLEVDGQGVPAPEDGVLQEDPIPRGTDVAVGEVIAIMETDAAASDNAIAPVAAAAAATAPEPGPVTQTNGTVQAVQERVDVAMSSVSSNGSSGRFYSPLVRSIAKKEGIAMQELEAIQGSGRDGRVTKKDILAYLPNKGSVVTQPSEAPQVATTDDRPEAATVKTEVQKSPVVPMSGGDEIIEMDRMRKLIADHMVMSKQVSPHVTSYVEADVTGLVEWRNRVKGPYQAREGQKLTFTPIFIEAIAKAIRDFPMINVSVNGKIIKRKTSILAWPQLCRVET